jgi:hypothetical protein
MDALRASVFALFQSKRFWLLQFVANPVLFAIATLWLLIPEAQTWHVIATALAALVVLIALLWLHGATFAYFHDFHRNGSAQVRTAFRATNLLAFALWALLFAFLLHVVNHLAGEFEPRLGSYLRSISPIWLRRNISEARMDSLVSLKFWVLFWIVVPALLLPFGMAAANFGFGGFGKRGVRVWRNAAGSRVYWSLLILLALVGVYVPQALIHWIPTVSSVSAETASLVVRFLMAWFLAATVWTLLASVLGRVGHLSLDGDVAGESAK